MNKINILLFCLLFASSVFAVEDLIPIGGTESNSIDLITKDIKSDSIDINLLNSPKIQNLLRQESELIGIGKIPIIVQFKDKLTANQKGELLGLFPKIDHEYSIIPAAAFSIEISKLNELTSLAFVKSVEYDADTRIVLAQSTTQIGASRVWLSHGIEGEGIIVAVLDTGIDNKHSDLQNVVKEVDFTGEGTNDEQGHGTHVASTVAGSGSASGGLNKGVAPKAKLMDVKVLGRTGSGKLSDTIGRN